jgi:hypothetical protein
MASSPATTHDINTKTTKNTMTTKKYIVVFGSS